MGISIEASSPESPFAQLRDQIQRQVLSGELTPGTRLPTVRALATDLGLAANTVARAYRELETAGLVETRGRLGTVITARAAGTSLRAQQAADSYAAATRALGVPPETALALVKAALGI